MDKSFQIIRTNPRLTTNVKLVVNSDNSIYLESFNSSKELSDQKYKHILLNRESLIEDEMPRFYDELPKKIAFAPKSELDMDVMYDRYENQFDNTYYSGANEVEDQWYKEEFEYFAPLYIKKNEIPKKFMIMRVDDAAIYELDGQDYSLSNLTNDNFRSEIIDKWKCTTVFDLTDKTNVGKFFDRNINDNDRFPDFSFFFDTKKYNYSKWAGMSYSTGVYTSSELFLDDKLFYENKHFNLEEFITKGFEENDIIYPYIYNMKFLFDDEPGTPEKFNKYSMNRYYGFYADDFEVVKTVTSYPFEALKTATPAITRIVIKNNIFVVNGNPINPFINESIKEEWVQYKDSFYKVKKLTNGSYKVISDTDLTGVDSEEFNNGFCSINYINGKNVISGLGEFDSYVNTIGETVDMYADLYLMEIDGLFHVLKKDGDLHTLHTDYGIISDKTNLRYWKGGKGGAFDTSRNVFEQDGKPLAYKIHRVKFTDIKDFDFDRIDTKYSDFDYEKSTYHETPEIKLSATEYRDSSIPMRKKLHDKGDDGQYKIMNISSEYSAGDETFELQNKGLTALWEKNQTICKWSYSDSISHSDYPYKLNNSNEISGLYNRTVNTSQKTSNIKEKTLDYFYRIGELYSKDNDPMISGVLTPSEWDNLNPTYNTFLSGNTIISLDHQDVPSSGRTNDVFFEFLNEPLYLNDLYSVKFKMVISNTNSGYIAGVDSGVTFVDGTNDSITDQEITFDYITRAQGTRFMFIAVQCNAIFYEIEIIRLRDNYYINQSTNIQTKLHDKFDINKTTYFDLNHYLNSDFDYFDFFFKNNMYSEAFGKLGKKQYKKYSIFNGGDNDLPTSALFKGIEYNLFSVEDMVLNSAVANKETIRTVITQGGEKFNGYKMAVVSSEYYDNYEFDKAQGLITDENTINYEYGAWNTPVLNPSVTGFNYVNNNNLMSFRSASNHTGAWTGTTTQTNTLSQDVGVIYNGTIKVLFEVDGNNGEGTFICNSFSTPISETRTTTGTTITLHEIDIVLNNVTAVSDDLVFEFSHSTQTGIIQVSQATILSIDIDKSYNGIVYDSPVLLNSENKSLYGLNNLIDFEKSGIHVIVNEKYKNMLVIVNINIAINNEWYSLNNVDVFGENHGLYYGKTKDNKYNIMPTSGLTGGGDPIPEYDPNMITAYNYMETLNNLNIKPVFETLVSYYYVDKNGNFAKTKMTDFNTGNNSMTSLPDWENKFPPFILSLDSPTDIKLKKNSYDVEPLKGPETNIYDKYLVYSNRRPLLKSYIDQPLSRVITIDKKDSTIGKVYHGERVVNNKLVKRFVGFYEPIFSDITIFNPSYYWYDSINKTYHSIVGNYVFSDKLENFGKIEELMYSKVNDEENTLKLKDVDDDRSVYPMVDEIGLSQTKRNILLSSWDKEFYIKTLNEQTLLEDYIEVPEFVVQQQIHMAITSVEINSFTIGDNIYGFNKSGSLAISTTMDITVHIKNISEIVANAPVTLKLSSPSGLSVVINSGVINNVPPNGEASISFTINKPSETQTGYGLLSYTEFTKWNIVASVTDSNGGDSNSDADFFVYNDIIDLEILDVDDFTTQTWGHVLLTSQPIDIKYNLNDISNKVPSIRYKTTFSIKDNNDNFRVLKTLISNISDTDLVTFSNVDIGDLVLGIPQGGDVTNRDARFYVEHEYVIEGVTHKVTDIDETVTVLLQHPIYKLDFDIAPAQLSIYENCFIDEGEPIPNQYPGDIVHIAYGVKNNSNVTWSDDILVTYHIWKNGHFNKPDTLIWFDSQTHFINNPIVPGATRYILGFLGNDEVLETSLSDTFYAIITSTQINSTKTTGSEEGASDLSIPHCGGDNCVDEISPIQLSNGSTIQIRDIKLGDEVLSCNINNEWSESLEWTGNIYKNSVPSESIVTGIRKRVSPSYYNINDGLIKLTPSHILLVKDLTNTWFWTEAQNVEVGYKLFTDERKEITIYKKEYILETLNIVQIDVESVDNYYVCGILSHNKDLPPDDEFN